MKKIVWTFGLISGAMLSAMMLVTIPFVHSIGFEHGMLIGYTTMVLAFLLVFFGVRSYRDNVGGGRVGFGRALAVGTLIALVASASYVVTWEVIYFGIAPEYADQMQNHMLETARNSGESPQVVQKKVADMEEFMRKYRNPAFNAAVTFLEPLPVGLVFALVSAGIVSRRRRPEEAGRVALAA